MGASTFLSPLVGNTFFRVLSFGPSVDGQQLQTCNIFLGHGITKLDPQPLLLKKIKVSPAPLVVGS